MQAVSSDPDKSPSQEDPRAPSAKPASIPLCVPELRGNERDYVRECLDSTFVSSVGPFVDRFERELARRVGTRFAVATSSGTAALHTALQVAGVGVDDEVITSTLTFVAPANAIRYLGAWPVLIDAEPDYWQMDPDKVADFLEKECHWRNGTLYNSTTRRKIKAILPVHILGHPVNIDPILELARKYNLIVVEDATEALGAKYKGRAVGHLGDIACFSFNGNKIITTGGGGMIVTDREDWANRAKYLTTQAKDDPVEFIHGEIGYNYRLTNIQAALGCAQLELLDAYVVRKKQIAERYEEVWKDKPGFSGMKEAEWAESIWWMYTVLIDTTKSPIGSRSLLRYLDERGIQTRPLWQPLHRSPAHRGAVTHKCEVADQLNRDALSLPCSVGLSDEQQDRVIGHISELAS